MRILTNRLRWVLGGAVLLLLVCVVAAFVTPWSRSCEEERETAAVAWDRYIAHLAPGTRQAEGARAVRARLDEDPSAAIDEAESLFIVPDPDDDVAGSLYREAMETLVLADGACGGG